jgi:hypothetical protein
MEEQTVKIVFTEELRQEWMKTYFKQHPRARKEPIQYCTHPSINTWCILPRISMNTLKKNWGDFTKFVIEKNGLSMIGISKCECTVVIHQPTKGRADNDNYSLKFVNDSLVDNGVLVDDSYFIISQTTTKIIYDKGVRQMDIIFSNCEYDLEELKIAQEKSKIKKDKRQETLDKNKTEKKSKKRTTKKK